MKMMNGNCLDLMMSIEAKSIDLVICDPPYGTTPYKWDNVLDFSIFWDRMNYVLKDNATVVLFGQEPFSSYVRLSNIKDYKYDWYWKKERLTNVFQVKSRPGKIIENIMVFHKKDFNYHPQKIKHNGKPVSNKIGENARWSVSMGGENPNSKPFEYKDDGTRYPLQLLEFNRDNIHNLIHPTQKPIGLLTYLLKTYSKEGDIVLDPTMGSGSLGVACIQNNRDFIGIELEKDYYDKAVSWIKETDTNFNFITNICKPEEELS